MPGNEKDGSRFFRISYFAVDRMIVVMAIVHRETLCINGQHSNFFCFEFNVGVHQFVSTVTYSQV